MVFPDSPLDVRAELYMGGALGWVDVSGDLRSGDPVTISRGRRPYASRVDPGMCALTLNNAGGRYSPRNPRSPYYGLLGRNTPIRVSVPGMESYLVLDGRQDGSAATGPAPSLGLSAGIDVRIEATTNWRELGADLTLIGQYDGATDGGWIMRLNGDGRVSLFVPTTGGSGGMNVPLPTTLPERAAVRITFVADDGTGTAQNHIYVADSLDGPWTQIGHWSQPSQGEMIDSALPVEIAPVYETDSGEPRIPIEGLVHRAEVRAGVDGPIVANPDFRPLPEGTTEFVDGAGLTWTVADNATVTDRNYRFHGEVSEWPPRWDTSGSNQWISVRASGVLRRMRQGAPVLQSTLRRRIPGGGAGQPGPLAYWPMEEGQYATQAAAAVEGVRPLRTSGLQWASNTSLFGSAPLPTVGQLSTITGFVPVGSGEGWHVDLAYFLGKLPDSESRFLQLRLAGSRAATFAVSVSTAGVRLEAWDADGVLLSTFLYDEASALEDLVGLWNRMQLFTTTSGSTTYMYAYWRDVITGDIAYAFLTVPDTGPGRVASVSAEWRSELAGMAVGHLGVWDVGGTADADGFNPTPGISYFDDADDGYEGEAAYDRVQRLAEEEDLTVFLHDGPGVTEQVGPQRVQPVLDLIEEAAAADGGLMHEHQRTPNLAVRFRSTMYNQAPALVLDYAPGEVAPPLEPVDSDQDVRNDVEVKREGGSSARAVLRVGPLSVLPPPDGIGLVNESVTLNLARDSQAEPMAHWRLHVRTVDEAQYPTVHVRLHQAPHLIPAVQGMRVLDRLQILNPPEDVPPGPIDLIADGWTETLGIWTWDITFNCSPGSPWVLGTVAEGDGTDGPAEPNRADTSGSVVALDADDAATTLLVHTEQGPTWVESASYPGDFPFDVSVGGEVCRASAIEPAGTDTFSRDVTDGWGTSAGGLVWTTSGGAASDFSVHALSGKGRIHLATTPTTLRFAEVLEHWRDAEQVATFSVDQLPGAGMFLSGLFFRAGTVEGATVLYWLNLALNSAGAVGIEVRDVVTPVAGTTVPGLSYAPGTRLRLRGRIDGYRVRGRVWIAGTQEPNVWQVDHVIAGGSIPSGSIGVTVASTDGTTTPMFMVDDYQIVTPQLFTVQRGINGLTKAHAAGTDVRLAQPTVVAL